MNEMYLIFMMELDWYFEITCSKRKEWWRREEKKEIPIDLCGVYRILNAFCRVSFLLLILINKTREEKNQFKFTFKWQ